jgi:hypothetical protein
MTVIDLGAMGFGGTFLPAILTKAIETTKKNEPLLLTSILTDPLVKRVLENPLLVVKEVMDAAMDAADYAKVNA